MKEWTPERIKALRNRLGLTQGEFAAVLGFARLQSVSDMERGGTVTGTTARLLDYVDLHGVVASSPATPSPADRAERIAEAAATLARELRELEEPASAG